MFQAAMAGDLPAIRNLLSNHASLVWCHYAYRTPLYFAVRDNKLAAASLLLERGADRLSVPFHDSLLDIETVALKIAAGDQSFTVYGDSYSNARAGLPFVNSSTGASHNSGRADMPGSCAPTSSTAAPASSTYSTYFGAPAYKRDARTDYPVNSGDGIRRLAVGFRTGNHTASSVPVTAEGPGAYNVHRLHGPDRPLLQDGGSAVQRHVGWGQVCRRSAAAP